MARPFRRAGVEQPRRGFFVEKGNVRPTQPLNGCDIKHIISGRGHGSTLPRHPD